MNLRLQIDNVFIETSNTQICIQVAMKKPVGRAACLLSSISSEKRPGGLSRQLSPPKAQKSPLKDERESERFDDELNDITSQGSSKTTVQPSVNSFGTGNGSLKASLEPNNTSPARFGSDSSDQPIIFGRGKSPSNSPAGSQGVQSSINLGGAGDHNVNRTSPLRPGSTGQDGLVTRGRGAGGLGGGDDCRFVTPPRGIEQNKG